MYKRKTRGEQVQVVCLDFETFYSKTFSLSKLTTEEYLRSPEFQTIGYSIKIDDGKTKWYTGSHEELLDELNKVDWDKSMLLCHNTLFDGAILSWIFGLQPFAYLDTLCMARAIHGVNAGGSLKALAERYSLGEKGTEVLDALGKRLEDFQPHELHRYGQYCNNDVELTYNLFKVLSQGFPVDELKLIDITLRMYTNPVLTVDDGLLITRLDEVKDEKQKLLSSLMNRLKCDTEEEVRKKLASNKQFAELLQELGVVVPLKVSPATGKDTFALAKNDIGFKELQEHENSFIQELCRVRLGTKSTMEESRIERFLDIGARNKGSLPMPLKYYGAHTGRWSGLDKVNMQNLPSRDVKKKALKNAILPPKGHVIINVDSSQIEARILVWLAGQDDVIEQFKNNEDVYSNFASRVYGKKIDKRNKTERFIGKTCILGLGYGTGWKKLQDTLKTQPPYVDVPDHEAQRYVKTYRDLNFKVTQLWKNCDKALEYLDTWETRIANGYGKPYSLDKHNSVEVSPQGLKLPNGLYIKYPELRYDTTTSQGGYVYKKRFGGEVSLWGGAVVENVVQALARIIIGEQMIRINERYKPVLTVHDAVVCVAPEEEKDEALKFIMGEMSKAPDWAPDLPITCEGEYGKSYGDC